MTDLKKDEYRYTFEEFERRVAAMQDAEKLIASAQYNSVLILNEKNEVLLNLSGMVKSNE